MNNAALDEYGPATTLPPPRVEPQQQSQIRDGGGSTFPSKTFHVLDTTAIASCGIPAEDRSKGLGPRTHHMTVDGAVKAFTFPPNEPLELPIPTAIKFLRIPSFKRTDADGNVLPYQRQPKQPHELGAGEQFKLEDHQTVADYNELTNMALLQRALELPGGELQSPRDREGLIGFIIKTMTARRLANLETARRAVAAAAKAAQPQPPEDTEERVDTFEGGDDELDD